MVEGPHPTAVICLSPYRGGMELYAIKLATMLADSCDVTLVCKDESFLHQTALERGVERIWPIAFRNKDFSPAIIRSTRRLLHERGIRNVIFFGASELKSLYFAFRGLPVNVIVRHATTKSRPKKDFLHRWIYGCVHHHVAISEHIARNVRHIVPIPKEARLHVIYPSFNLGDDVEPKPAGGRVELLHVGRTVPGKGHRDALQACRALEQAQIPFRLRFLGTGPDPAYREELAATIASRPDPGAYELVGHVADVTPYLAESDVFLFPSYGEGFGNAFNEALGSGLVCLAYRNTVFPEFQTQGFHLHLVADRDSAALGRALRAVAEDLPAEKERAAANIDLAREFYARSRELREYLALLQ